MMRQAIKINIVRDEGAAQASGIQRDDIIVRYGDRDTLSPDDLTRAIADSPSGADVILIRSGTLRKVSVRPGPLGISFGEVSVEVPNEPALDLLAPVPDREAADLERIIVTTAPSIDGYKAISQLGVISAECVFGLNFFKDFFAAMTDIFGGRSKTTQSALRDARETCIRELKREAMERGANAIIAVDLDYSEFSGQGKSMLFLVATGTAVVIEETVGT